MPRACGCCNRLLDERDWARVFSSYAPILNFWHELDPDNFPQVDSRIELQALFEEGHMWPTPMSLFCGECRRLEFLEWDLIEAEFHRFVEQAMALLQSSDPGEIMEFCAQQESELLHGDVHRLLWTYTDWLMGKERSAEEIGDRLTQIERLTGLITTPRLAVLFALRHRACVVERSAA